MHSISPPLRQHNAKARNDRRTWLPAWLANSRLVVANAVIRLTWPTCPAKQSAGGYSHAPRQANPNASSISLDETQPFSTYIEFNLPTMDGPTPLVIGNVFSKLSISFKTISYDNNLMYIHEKAVGQPEHTMLVTQGTAD